MYFRIIFLNFLRNFIVVITTLMLFFVFIDYMMNVSKLPDSINLEILYIFYNSMNASITIYSLTLVFATLMTILNLVKTNEMVAYLSIGYSFKRLLFPIMTGALLVSLIFIFLQSITNVSFQDRAKSILSGEYFKENVDNNLFFKYRDTVIYMKKLDSVKKTAYGMKLFSVKDGHIQNIYEVSKAKFINNEWLADEIVKYSVYDTEFKKEIVNIHLLKGFKPDILNKLESKKAMTLKIAVQALYLFKKGNIDLNFIKTYIYNAIIPPITFILLISLIVLRAPIHPRISNISLYVFVTIFSSILLWGMFLLAQKMSISGIVSPEIAFFTPFIFLLSFTIYYFRKI